MWNFRQFVDEYPQASEDWSDKAKDVCALAAELRNNPAIELDDNYTSRGRLSDYLDSVEASPAKRDAGTALWNEFTGRMAQQGI